MQRIHEQERTAQERDKPASPAPISQAARILALQRTVGNHAVAAMLAREAKPKQAAAPSPGLAILQGIASIPCLSVQLNQRADSSHGQRSDAPPSEIMIMAKQSDQSPVLENAARSGQAFEADVFIGDKVHLKLHKALVSSYRLDNAPDGPIESWTLNSESVEFVTDER
jgi:hypothetical protein